VTAALRRSAQTLIESKYADQVSLSSVIGLSLRVVRSYFEVTIASAPSALQPVLGG
jgi:hypothetical protein